MGRAARSGIVDRASSLALTSRRVRRSAPRPVRQNAARLLRVTGMLIEASTPRSSTVMPFPRRRSRAARAIRQAQALAILALDTAAIGKYLAVRDKRFDQTETISTSSPRAVRPYLEDPMPSLRHGIP